jgi:Domain of unknown function (DUF4158)
MKQVWTREELIEHWTLGASELALLMNKSGMGRLGFALLLKFFQTEGRFPANENEMPEAAIEYVARQTEVAASSWAEAEYDWQGRTIKYHRARNSGALGLSRVDATDASTDRLEPEVGRCSRNLLLPRCPLIIPLSLQRSPEIRNLAGCSGATSSPSDAAFAA